MMKEKIRDQISSYKGEKLRFKYNGARNQIEEFIGYIEQAYSNVFTIRLSSQGDPLRTFSYNDVLMEMLEIHKE